MTKPLKGLSIWHLSGFSNLNPPPNGPGPMGPMGKGPWARTRAQWAWAHGPMGKGPWARAHGPNGQGPMGPMGQGPWARTRAHPHGATAAALAATTAAEEFPNLHIVDHPLVLHKLSHLRDETTCSHDFRALLRERVMLIVLSLHSLCAPFFRNALL